MTLGAAWSLQAGLYAALSQDDDLQSMLGDPPRLFDAVPEDAVFPLVQLGAVRMSPAAGIGGGFEHIIRLTVLSRWGGRKECKTIAARIHALLQNARLPLSDHKMMQARLVFEDYLRIREPDLYQGALRYRFITVPANWEAAA